MKKLFFIRHMHGKYIGANSQLVDFEKARIFARRSDATLAMKSNNYDDLFSIFVLEISDVGIKHSSVKPLPKGEIRFKPPTMTAYPQGIRPPDDDEVLPELNLRSHEDLNAKSFTISDIGSLDKFAADEEGTYIPSFTLPDEIDRTVTISPDLNKVKDTANKEVKPSFKKLIGSDFWPFGEW